MNIQPLELYGDQASFGGGMKLLNRTYDGPLIKIIRTVDGVSVNVYPDVTGKVSLDSYIEVGTNISNATTLGQFLHQPGYTPDSVIAPTNVTAEVTLIYDQSPNSNNYQALSNPRICHNGEIFTSEFGMEIVSSILGEFGGVFVGNAPDQSFTVHIIGKPAGINVINTEVFNTHSVVLQNSASSGLNSVYFSQATNELVYTNKAVYKINNLIGEKDPARIFVDEDYINEYTSGIVEFDPLYTENVGSPATAEDINEKILTVEVTALDANYSESNSIFFYGISRRFNSVIVYNGIGNATRRHKTNQILVEGVPNLENQLIKFSPTSFYNAFYGAKGIYSAIALADLNHDTSIKILQAQRGYEIGISPTTVILDSTTVDVYTDNSGQISLESPIVVTNGSSNATKFGDFLNAPNYNNVDNLNTNIDYNGYTTIIYDQSVYGNHATKFGPEAALLYNKAADKFEPYLSGTEKSIVRGFNFKRPTASFPAVFSFPFGTFNSPKSIIFVFANSGSTNKIQSQLGGFGFGAGYFSRTFNVTDYGIEINGPSSTPVTTAFGYDTNVHIMGISLGNTPTLRVDNETPITFTLNSNADLLKFNQLGPLYGTLLAAIVYDEDRLDDFSEIFQYLTAFFGVENNTFPELLTNNTFNGKYPGATYIFSTQQLTQNLGKIAKFSIPATSGFLNVTPGLVTKELYNQDVIAIAQSNDAEITELYNHLNPFSDNYLSSSGINMYDGATQTLTRATSSQAIIIPSTQSGELFTTQTKISLQNNFSIYIIGETPTTDCNLLGDGTCSVSFVGGEVVVTTTAGTYNSIETLSSGEFFIIELTRNSTSLVIGLNTLSTRKTRYEHTITANEAFEFNTVLGDSPTDTTAYTGTLQSLIVYETNKFSNELITKLYQEHKQTTYPPVSSSIPVPAPTISAPIIESYSTISGSFPDSVQSITMDLPTGVESGDLLLLIYSAGKNNGMSTSNSGFDIPPAGWSLLVKEGVYGSAGISIWYKVADGSETNFSATLYSRNIYSADMYYTLSILRISKVNTTTMFEPVGSTIDVSNNTTSIPSINTTYDYSLAFAVASYDGADMGSFEPNSPWVEYLELEHVDGEAYGTSCVIATQIIETAGNTGDATIVVSGGAYDGMVGVQFAINSSDVTIIPSEPDGP